MATAEGVRLPAPTQAQVWGRRVTEWAVLGLVILVLVVLFGRHMRQLQARAELAALKTTLGTLRATLVVDHLQQRLRDPLQSVAQAQRNPFTLLDRLPANYAGEMIRNEGAVPAPGSWVFDRVCVCIGYAPLFPQWFESASGDPSLWFRVSGAAGPRELSAVERYVWLDETLQ